MEIICEHCRAKLNIPDGSISSGRKVSGTCPRCKEKLTFAAKQEMDEGQPFPVDIEKLTGVATEKRQDVFEYEDEALEYYDEGVRLAIVLGDDAGRITSVRQALETLGFRSILAENIRMGIEKMRIHHFKLVIFVENFGGFSPEHSPVLDYLNHLSMQERRSMFVVVVGNHFKTMDRMTAFALSVNLVVNEKDMGQLATILKRALSENEKFYKVFMETLREIGRC